MSVNLNKMSKCVVVFVGTLWGMYAQEIQLVDVTIADGEEYTSAQFDTLNILNNCESNPNSVVDDIDYARSKGCTTSVKMQTMKLALML